MTPATLLDYTKICAACAAMAFLLGVAGPALDEARDTAASVADAEQQAQREAARSATLRARCGENAAALPEGEFLYRCATKRGFKTTLTARVQL